MVNTIEDSKTHPAFSCAPDDENGGYECEQ